MASGYQGWANYETWAVALWCDNDEGLYHERIRLAEDFKAPEDADEWSDEPRFYDQHTAATCPGKPCGACCDHKERVHDVDGFAREIKEWVEGMMPDLDASLASDLLGSALSDVDWAEIAEHWLED